MTDRGMNRRKLGALLWLGGMVGVISLLPVLPTLASNLSDRALPPVWVLMLGSTVQTGLILAWPFSSACSLLRRSDFALRRQTLLLMGDP